MRRKRAKRRNIAIAGTAVFLMLMGIGLVSATYYVDDVSMPENVEGGSLAQSTVVMYSDGTTPMARLGDQTRTIVTFDAIAQGAKDAVVAAEDTSFYNNDGVDLKGIIRAAVNNVTGGDRQGASTITQQYARAVLEDNDVTYARKLREAVLAMKIKERFSDEKILEMYLNTVYFGRGAYGIEAASQAFFGKSAKDLSTAEGMILAGVIKQPEGNGGSPYDPTVNEQMAKDRFEYVKKNMVKLGYLPEADAAQTQVPTVKKYNAADAKLKAQWGLDTPTGLIVHHVLDEISQLTVPGTGADGEKRYKDVRNSGLKIVTTIDKKMQEAAQAAAANNGAFFKSMAFKDSEKLQAALVAVEPGTGKVKAYYGGDGKGTDYAGRYKEDILSDGEWSQGGMHPPGSTMKIYTLAGALMSDYTIDSIWDASSNVDFTAYGRSKSNPVKNAGENVNCRQGERACTLEESTKLSLNIPFYGVTTMIGPQKVVEAARGAGIRYMTDTNDKVIDLSTIDVSSKEAVRKHFNYEVGFGQYPISPLEHANGVATIAARGLAAQEHFIEKIYKNGQAQPDYEFGIKVKQVAGLTQRMADDMNYVLQEVVDYYGLNLKDTSKGKSRESAGKSGTWQLRNTKSNAHGWFVGYTARDTAKKSNGLAAAVWVGSKGKEEALQFRSGKSVIGGRSAGPIWQKFMQTATTGMTIVKFANKGGSGTIRVGNGVEMPVLPWDPNQGNNGNGNGNDNGNGNGNGNVPNLPGTLPTVTANPIPSREND